MKSRKANRLQGFFNAVKDKKLDLLNTWGKRHFARIIWNTDYIVALKISPGSIVVV